MATAGDPAEGSEEFMMHSFKVLPCPKGYRHNWKRCPFAHEGESERRRDPRVFKYSAVVCPATKKGVECPSGDDCPWAHNVFEYWLHPQRFRTEMCSKKDTCKRRFCFFAHSKSELRESKVEMESPSVAPNPGVTTVVPRDHPARNMPSYGCPSNVDIHGLQGMHENTAALWQMDVNGNGYVCNPAQGSFLKHEIHDSLASLPENIGWNALSSEQLQREELHSSLVTHGGPRVPPLYLQASSSTDRLPQDMREQLASAIAPTRMSPRQDIQQMMVPPLQPCARSASQHLDENLQSQVTPMRFSPRQTTPAPHQPTVDRFSPRQANIDPLASFAGWSDIMSSIDSVQDILLASGMSHATWNFSPLDSVDERITNRTSFGSAMTSQTLRLLESLDLNNNNSFSMEQQAASMANASADALLCDHLNFFTDP